MTATDLATPWRVAVLAVAGVGAGLSNGIAGGGTFVSFPTLLALGVAPLQANVSSTVGLVPSVLGGTAVFRRELRAHRLTLKRLMPWCVLGSLIGTALLLLSPVSTFDAVVPWLVGVATLLFALAPLITRALARRRAEHEDAPVRPRLMSLGVLVASIYGGYFGAGLGIVLLAVLALSLPEDIYTLQGIRVTLGLLTNAVAALVFVVRGHLAMVAVLVLAVSSLVGGYLGTSLVKRLSPRLVRAFVIAIGAFTFVRLVIG